MKSGYQKYQSQSGDVEAEVIYSRTGKTRHAKVKFRWIDDGLTVSAHLYFLTGRVEYWVAMRDSVTVDTRVPEILPEGTAEAVFTIMALGEMNEGQ